MAFLDSTGAIVPSPTESWRDEVRERSRTPTRAGPATPQPPATPGAESAAGRPSAADASLLADAQLAVLISEKQARVISLPSQTCLYRINFTNDAGFAVTSSIISLKGTWLLSTSHFR